MAIDDLWHFKDPNAQAKAAKAGVTSRCAKKCPCRGRQWPTKNNPGWPGSPNSWESSRWRVRYAGVQTQSFIRQADAEAYERKAKDDKQKAKAGVPQFDASRGNISLREYALQVWLPNLASAERTLEGHRTKLNLHILPRIGDMKLNQIDLSTMVGFFAKLHREPTKRTGRPLGSGAIMNIYVMLGSLLKAAQLSGRIQQHPFQGLEQPKVPPRPEVHVWEDGVVDALLLGLPEFDRTMAELAIQCGHRINEVLGVTKRDVLSLQRKIVVSHQLGRKDGKLVLVPPKHNSVRTVPMSQDMVDTLALHMASHPTIELPCVCHGKMHELVFSYRGRPIGRPAWAQRVWHPALHHAASALVGSPLLEGISLDPGSGEHSGFHQLRHYCASVWIAGGATPTEVAKWLGHSDTTHVDRCYGHLFRRHEDKARDISAVAAAARRERLAALAVAQPRHQLAR